MIYRIFLFLDVLVMSVILLSTYNIKILFLIVSFLNKFEYVVLRMNTFTLIDISTIFIINSFLFLVNPTSSDSTLILIDSLITFYYLETSFSSISLSSKSFSDSFSIKNKSFEILDSSSLKLISSFSLILSR